MDDLPYVDDNGVHHELSRLGSLQNLHNIGR